ncbi:hypothetical protein KGF54_002309 [Candida jiufengensis]|uniref:uncharacterized protein n=1 Tax=Candida jiufengensis TaxID=497108 RepID=UPI0022250B17|nr:uncharacterized protein KGF54_002309 [Candida jiufengensis]KAI5954534.1 hypothetical protein KGF54_002309 [Candida jiufengensis]
MSSPQPTPTFKVGLTPEEKSLYTQLFKSLDPDNTGIITGEKARSTFEKSNLPPAILGEIWQLADQNNLGFLNQYSFCYAMRLIGYTQSGQHPTPGLADTPGPLPKFANIQQPQRLQTQSTSNSFLSSQPNNTIPQSATPQVSLKSISSNDYQKFSQLFIKTVGSYQGELGGAQARDIFMKARLPTPVLGQIWSLVDRNNTGILNVGAFVIAMHLIQGLLSGQIKQLPPFLPESIWQSVENHPQPQSQQQQQQQPQPPQSSPSYQPSSRQSSISSQQTAIRHQPSRDFSGASTTSNNEWVATPTMRAQFDSVFNSLDKENVGHLNPDQVASFLMTSKLNQQDLASIWDLADIQNTGQFTKLEFGIALFLVNRKVTGHNLPNVIPESLINSLKSSPQPSQQQQQQTKANDTRSPPPSQYKPKSSIDDLADIFGTSSPQPTAPSKQHELQQRASSSDLSHGELPKVRSTLTGSFKPTSTFGQTLLQQQSPLPSSPSIPERKEEDLLGEDVSHKSIPAPTQKVSSPPVTTDTSGQKQVNYDALRSVPPPPVKKQSTQSESVPQGRSYSQQSQPPQNNNDLLADPYHSQQLSQATLDLANVSNQINSLRTQTTSLDEKKNKTEQELKKLLNAKSEFESKLKLLRTSYENEVKQVKQVEESLATAKEETEALRSEASISEAKLNSLSNELHNKQIAVEELQKENNTLKEKLGVLNAETVELEKQLASKQSDTQELHNKLSVQKSQAHVVIVKNEDLKSKIAEIEASHKELQQRIDDAEKERLAHEQHQQELHDKQKELENNKPSKPSSDFAHAGIIAGAGAAVGAAIGGVASAVSHSFGGSDEHEQETQSISTLEQQHTNNIEQVNKGVKELSTNEPVDNATNATSSSITTEHPSEADTPITSPSNSEFQFPQGNNAGIAGGMVGMPGVLVGVQRTESLTSSVQNNAALSVRDDNIDVSDRDTIDQAPEESRESDKGSSSFEMVNSEEARSPDNSEFPPIRELDYQESDSEDEDSQNFDDAKDNFKQPQQDTTGATITGTSQLDDDAFADLEPAAPETNTKDDFFDENFDNLEAAAQDDNIDDEFDNNNYELGNDFTNSNAPNFEELGGNTQQSSGSDEWEQLFAGFGNAQPIENEINESQSASPQEDPNISVQTDHKTDDYAVQELIGMGFDKQTAIEALKNQNGDLEAATNYLLDNA